MRIHYNLHAARSGGPSWVMHNGKHVAGYARSLTATVVRPHVNRREARRIAKGKARSVHASRTTRRRAATRS